MLLSRRGACPQRPYPEGLSRKLPELTGLSDSLVVMGSSALSDSGFDTVEPTFLAVPILFSSCATQPHLFSSCAWGGHVGLTGSG